MPSFNTILTLFAFNWDSGEMSEPERASAFICHLLNARH